MQLSKSQQTLLIVQSACIIGVYMAAKYFRDLMQLSDLKYRLKGGKIEGNFEVVLCRPVAKIPTVFRLDK